MMGKAGWTMIALLFLPHVLRPMQAQTIDFTRDVRPILAGHCFKCHGPDDKTLKGKLRLDVRDKATAQGRSGLRAIVPGKPNESELVRRISTLDATDVMPPPSAKKPLSEAQKQILKRWIGSGADYQIHWSFQRPRQSVLPPVKQIDWPRNAVDYFDLSRLEAAGLRPSPAADRLTLIRRVYIDLIGLPPTPQEADTFVSDPSPDAYEKVVDRLLASPHYGERWARRWLDLARYADTNGYEKDRPRSIWPYRDWVINALNADMPFDQFTVEQLAGDLLPEASVQQKIATGFHRNTMINEEGGIDPLEFRFHAMTDRVGTTGTVWLGLTLGCVQCHSHKYDPIPQREYYQVMACLNNADEPELEIPVAEIAERRQVLQSEIAARRAQLGQRFPLAAEPARADNRPDEVRRREQLERKFRAWLREESSRAACWTALRPIQAQSGLPRLSILADDSILASGDQSKRDIYDLDFRVELPVITAIRLEVIPDDRLPKHGPGRVYYEGPFGDFFLSEFTMTADARPVRFRKASHSFASGNSGAAAAIDGDPLTGWSINGGQGKAHAAVFNLEKPLPSASAIHLRLLFERYYAAGLGRFRISVTSDKHDVEARGIGAELENVLCRTKQRPTEKERAILMQHFLNTAPELAKERAAIQKLETQLPAFPTSLVFAERPADNPRPTFLHRRGEFLQPTEQVVPDVPDVLPPLPHGAPRNRLTFARWLIDAGNPLVARVTMNRHWAAFFGRGIVRTTEDFGFQGELPTHPELLDWLAVELINQRWSIKQMHRLIVTSATYRQSSRLPPELKVRDPENKLLARGARFRMEAEQIRDAALAASGLLSRKLGGPSVFPPQPASVTSEGAYGSLAWRASVGADRYRRGLYTYSKRTAPFAMFTTFDAPSGESCVPRRELSNTPLQALTLLNDTVFLEAAQEHGRRLAESNTSVADRVTNLFRQCLTRPPSVEERAALVEFYSTQKMRIVNKELDAAAIVGGTPGGNRNEQAAWTLVARAVMNLDETYVKD